MTDEVNQESADYVAEMNCKCQEGMEHRNTEDMKDAAKTNVTSLFPDEDMKTIDVMYAAIEALAAGTLKKVSIKIDERTTCNLIKTQADGIKIKKDYKENFVLEANKF